MSYLDLRRCKDLKQGERFHPVKPSGFIQQTQGFLLRGAVQSVRFFSFEEGSREHFPREKEPVSMVGTQMNVSVFHQ